MDPIVVTDLAWEKLFEKLLASGYKNLHISLNNKGCGGGSYVFKPTNDEPHADEKFIKKGMVKVIVDAKAEIFIIGSTLDWVERDQFNKGFDIVSNQRETGRCGCGESIIFT